MKQLFVMALAVLAATACSKTENAFNGNGNQPLVTVSLISEDNGSRAFFDDSAAGESWESEILQLTLFCFDQNEQFVLRRDFSADEIISGKASFALPSTTEGKICTFYAVANAAVTTPATLNQLLAAISPQEVSKYNGTFATVTNGAALSSGFVMSGENSATIAAAGSTSLTIALKRLVSKVAVRTALADDFSSNYNGGTVVITTVSLENVSRDAYLFSDQAVSGFTTLSQVPDGSNRFDNLFYVHPREASTDQTVLVLKGYFKDAGSGQNDIGSEVEYSVQLDGSGNGLFRRNAYYKVDLTIKGITGSDTEVRFSVADWEGPINESHELGN